jgi:protein-S-isoprenylcysteine O-methyltransferase Ste14
MYRYGRQIMFSEIVSSKYLILFAVIFAARNIIDLLINPRKNPYAKGKRGKFSLLVLVSSFIVSGISVAYYLLFGGGTNLYSYYAGLLLLIAGYCGRRVAIRALGKNYNYAIEVSPEHELVTSGVYSVIRHPIYLFYMIEMMALVVIKFNYISLAALIAVILATLYRVEKEDELLLTVFKERFETYRRGTKRLIPFVY